MVRVALVGYTNVGKSTLMNVLSGQYPYGSYTGTVTYEGEECKFKKLNDSEAKGIVIIHQELALIPLLSIGENMFLGNEIKNKEEPSTGIKHTARLRNIWLR